MFNKSRCLITGGSGTVGRNIPFGYKISSKDYDLRDSSAVNNLFSRNSFESILHLGASVGGLGAHLDPKFKYNLLYDNLAINSNVIHYARKYNVKRILSYLSSCVFSDSCPSPYTEKMIYDGIPSAIHESYAHAKRLLCVHSQICFDEGFDYCSLIPVNIYGPNDDFSPAKSHFIASLIYKAFNSSKTGEDFIVWGDGKQTRDLIYVDDLVNITTWLLENYFEREPIIVCANRPVEIGYVASLIAKEFNVEKSLKFDTTKPVGQRNRVLSGNKLGSLIQFPFTPIEEGVKKSVKWFADNYPNVRL